MSYRILFDSEQYGSLREYEPSKRTICYRGASGPCRRSGPFTEGRLYYVQFPYTLFRWVNGVLKVGFLKHKLSSEDDLVYCPPLGNVYEEFRICGCDSNAIDTSIEAFWTKVFTNDGDRGELVTRLMFSRWWDKWRWSRLREVFGLRWGCWEPNYTRYDRWSKISRKRNAVEKISNLFDKIDNFASRFLSRPFASRPNPRPGGEGGISLHMFTGLWERNIDFQAPYENAMDKHIKLMQEEGILLDWPPTN